MTRADRHFSWPARGRGVTRPLEDGQSREGLVKGEYASDVEFLGWHSGCTRRAVAIDLGEGLGT